MSLINLDNFHQSNREKSFRKQIIQKSSLFATSKFIYAIGHISKTFVFISNCTSGIIKTNLLY